MTTLLTPAFGHASREAPQPTGRLVCRKFFSVRGHRCGGLCLLGQERHRPKEPPARRSLIDSSILTPTGEPAVRNGGAAAISPRADDSECLGAKPVKPTPLCARAHNGETRGFSRNPRAITTTFETQLLQVVGGPGKLFLPVGAKTCFGGGLSCTRGDKSVAHPTDRRPPEDSEVALAIGATSVSPIRRTGDTPVADGGHEGVLRSPTTHPLALP